MDVNRPSQAHGTHGRGYCGYGEKNNEANRPQPSNQQSRYGMPQNTIYLPNTLTMPQQQQQPQMQCVQGRPNNMPVVTFSPPTDVVYHQPTAIQKTPLSLRAGTNESSLNWECPRFALDKTRTKISQCVPQRLLSHILSNKSEQRRSNHRYRSWFQNSVYYQNPRGITPHSIRLTRKLPNTLGAWRNVQLLTDMKWPDRTTWIQISRTCVRYPQTSLRPPPWNQKLEVYTVLVTLQGSPVV